MLKLDKAETRTEADTTNKVVPPIGMTKVRMTRHHGYPARPARQTKATPALPTNKPKGFKLDDTESKTNVKQTRVDHRHPAPAKQMEVTHPQLPSYLGQGAPPAQAYQCLDHNSR